jgi:hypothetical protein
LLLFFKKPQRINRRGFYFLPTLNFVVMEGLSDQLPPLPDPLSAQQQQQFDAANDFLSICDRLSTGYDSGYYWEDVQRALRIAAGLEPWPN